MSNGLGTAVAPSPEVANSIWDRVHSSVSHTGHTQGRYRQSLGDMPCNETLTSISLGR